MSEDKEMKPVSSFLIQTGGFLDLTASYHLWARWSLAISKPNCWPQGIFSH